MYENQPNTGSEQIVMVLVSKHHGNTRRIAEAIAEVLPARILSPDEARQIDLSTYPLVGFGSGIYYARHDRALLDLATEASALPQNAFVFSTAGSPFLRRWFHQALRKRLERRGVKILGDFTCQGWDSYGPLAWIGGIFRNRPNAQDLERARDFARTLSRH